MDLVHRSRVGSTPLRCGELVDLSARCRYNCNAQKYMRKGTDSVDQAAAKAASMTIGSVHVRERATGDGASHGGPLTSRSQSTIRAVAWQQVETWMETPSADTLRRGMVCARSVPFRARTWSKLQTAGTAFIRRQGIVAHAEQGGIAQESASARKRLAARRRRRLIGVLLGAPMAGATGLCLQCPSRCRRPRSAD